jgi:hypothetical protein
MAIDTATTTPTRRAMLAGIAALPALGVAGQVHASQGLSVTLAEKIARWRNAEANLRTNNAYNAAHAAWDRACEAIPHRSFPELRTALYGEAYKAETEPTISTATDWLVSMARRVKNGEPIGKGGDEAWDSAMLTIADAAEVREAEKGRLYDLYRLDELGEAADAQCDAAADLYNEAVEHPASSVADVLLKLSAFRETDEDGARITEILTADLQRIAGRAQ